MSAIDDYLKNVDEPHKSELQKLRLKIKGLIPDATETISYGMPTLKLNNKVLIHFASFKDHMSIFPNPGPIESLAEELKNYKTSKGTIQFTVDNPMSDQMLETIIKLRLKEINKEQRG